ncbi:MAG: RHS repeat-associated core domain-containing protein [Bacteroidia bacterium]
MFEMVNGTATLIEEHHNYPFGMELSGPAFVGGGNPYRYTGKELETDLEIGLYDYGARWYDPAAGRWWGVDAMAEKYYGWSGYNYVMGNPLKYIDPNGQLVTYAGEDEREAYRTYRDDVDSRVKRYDSRTQELRDKGKTQKADKRDEKRAGNVFVQIQSELADIENSDFVFRVRMGENISNSSGGGNLSYNAQTKEIDVNLDNDENFTPTQKLAHEFTHAAQFLSRELDLSVDGKGGLFYDQTDEFFALERQNLFAPPGGATHSVVPSEILQKEYPGLSAQRLNLEIMVKIYGEGFREQYLSQVRKGNFIYNVEK